MRVTGTLVIVVCLLAGHGSLSTTGAGAWQAQPTINTINPSATLAGSPPFALTVNGTNFAADSVVRWNGSNRTTTFSSATQLTAQILAADVAAGGSAAVTVFNPASGATSNAVTLTITNPLPSLTALSPSAVPAGTGQLALTVTGTNFVAGAVVRWNGADRPTSFISGTQLTAQIAAADLAGAGFAAITVFNPAPGGGVSTPLSFAVNNLAPALSGLSPAAADAGGGDFTLTVNGTNFVNGSVVRWNGSDRPTVVTGPTQLSALIPASDLANAGPAGVTVFTPGPGGGTSNALTFTVNPPNPVPVLTSLSPGSAAVGGGDFTLTVTGANFVNGSVVRWNGSARATNFVSSTQLTAAIAAADIAAAGVAGVSVFNPAPGGGISGSLSFAINNPVPTIVSLSPNAGTAGGPAFTLTVNGSNLVNGAVVKWNGSHRPTTFVSATQVTAQIPAEDLVAAGFASVSVLNPGPGGGESGTLSFTINNPVAALTALSPASAVAGAGAFTLRVIGANFLSNSLVQWNGESRATAFVSASELTAQIPATDIATAGTAGVTVFTPGPGGGTSPALSFTVVAPNPTPAITRLAPASAAFGGGALTLTVIGTNFINGSVVRWNGSDRPTTFVSGTQLSAQILPADIAAVGDASVTVFNPEPGGGLSGALTFSVVNPTPAITGLSPASAIATGPGFTLTVTGAGFLGTSVVRWNGADRPTTFVSATELTAAIPAGDIATQGMAAVTVVTPAPGGGTSNAVSFTINPPNPAPTITSISPPTVTAGGPTFTLAVTGTNFVNGSVVRWNGANRPTTLISATQLAAEIPATDIAVISQVSITVFNPAPGGGTSGAVTFAITNPVPALTSLNPTSALAGGAPFTLAVTGANFVNGSVVRWNGANRPTTFVSPTQLTAAIPAGDIAVAGAAAITVFTPAPGGGISNALDLPVVNPNPVPVLASLSPSAAPLGAESLTLTANGSNFVGSSVLRWNGSARPTTYVSATQLTALIPAADLAAPGTANISVFTPEPGGGSSNVLTLPVNVSVPTLTGLSPGQAQAGSPAFTLTVAGAGFANDAVVRWNGANRPTTFVSRTQLRAEIQASDIATEGAAGVRVFNPGAGGGESGAVTFVIGTPVASVSAASFAGAELAADSIVAAYGAGLATGTDSATASPLPTTLAGTRLVVRDSAGVERNAPLFFVSPAQINYLMPPETALGPATVVVTAGDGKTTYGTTRVVTVAPGQFAANSDGQGIAAALALRVRGDGSRSFEPVAQLDAATGRFVPVPIDLGPEGEQVFLVLYGTGSRSRSSLAAVRVTVGGAEAEVLFAGAVPGLSGLDQVNARLSRALAGRGEVDVVLTVDGKAANLVSVSIK